MSVLRRPDFATEQQVDGSLYIAKSSLDAVESGDGSILVEGRLLTDRLAPVSATGTEIAMDATTLTFPYNRIVSKIAGDIHAVNLVNNLDTTLNAAQWPGDLAAPSSTFTRRTGLGAFGESLQPTSTGFHWAQSVLAGSLGLARPLSLAFCRYSSGEFEQTLVSTVASPVFLPMLPITPDDDVFLSASNFLTVSQTAMLDMGAEIRLHIRFNGARALVPLLPAVMIPCTIVIEIQVTSTSGWITVPSARQQLTLLLDPYLGDIFRTTLPRALWQLASQRQLRFTVTLVTALPADYSLGVSGTYCVQTLFTGANNVLPARTVTGSGYSGTVLPLNTMLQTDVVAQPAFYTFSSNAIVVTTPTLLVHAFVSLVNTATTATTITVNLSLNNTTVDTMSTLLIGGCSDVVMLMAFSASTGGSSTVALNVSSANPAVTATQVCHIYPSVTAVLYPSTQNSTLRPLTTSIASKAPLPFSLKNAVRQTTDATVAFDDFGMTATFTGFYTIRLMATLSSTATNFTQTQAFLVVMTAGNTAHSYKYTPRMHWLSNGRIVLHCTLYLLAGTRLTLYLYNPTADNQTVTALNWIVQRFEQTALSQPYLGYRSIVTNTATITSTAKSAVVRATLSTVTLQPGSYLLQVSWQARGNAVPMSYTVSLLQNGTAIWSDLDLPVWDSRRFTSNFRTVPIKITTFGSALFQFASYSSTSASLSLKNIVLMLTDL